jgi:ParB family transcriptional regulator, chromosome partitioning protein
MGGSGLLSRRESMIERPAPDPDTRPTLRIRLDDLLPSPAPARQFVDPDALEEMARTIRVVGVLQPILVRPAAEGKYTILAGSLRVAACQLAGLDSIDAVALDVTDDEALEIALVETLQHYALNPVDQARMIRGLLERRGKKAVAQLVGRTIRSVDLASAREGLPELVRYGIAESGLSGRHATAILRLNTWPVVQGAVFVQIVQHRLTAQPTEVGVRQLVAVLRNLPADVEVDAVVRALGVPGLEAIFSSRSKGAPSVSELASHAAMLGRDLGRFVRAKRSLPEEPAVRERLEEVRGYLDLLLGRPDGGGGKGR